MSIIRNFIKQLHKEFGMELSEEIVQRGLCRQDLNT